MKILIIRFSSIGDIVLTSPVIRVLKKQLGAEVHFLTKAHYSELLSANPYINKVHSYSGNFKMTLSILNEEAFDMIIDLHNNLRTLRFKMALGLPSKSFYKANIEKWLMVNFKINRLPEKHIVDRYLETVEALGVKNDGDGLDFFYKVRQAFKTEINLPSSYICIALGAAHKTKQIPSEITKFVVQNKSNNFVLIGGKDVTLQGEVLAKGNSNVINLAGKISISESAELINRSAVLLTGDTGMMHIGAALKKRMLVVWGNTIPAFGMYPYYGSNIIPYIGKEVEISCRPCSKTGYSECPKSHFKCMMNHSEQQITQSLEELMT